MYNNDAEKVYDLYLFYQEVIKNDPMKSMDKCPFKAACVNCCGVFFPECVDIDALGGCWCPCHYYGEEAALARLRDVLLENGYFL
jgi:hypothetical protein